MQTFTTPPGNETLLSPAAACSPLVSSQGMCQHQECRNLISLHSLVEAPRMVLTFGIVGGYWVSSKTRTASKDLLFWKYVSCDDHPERTTLAKHHVTNSGWGLFRSKPSIVEKISWSSTTSKLAMRSLSLCRTTPCSYFDCYEGRESCHGIRRLIATYEK